MLILDYLSQFSPQQQEDLLNIMTHHPEVFLELEKIFEAKKSAFEKKDDKKMRAIIEEEKSFIKRLLIEGVKDTIKI
jgi:UDP-N-acetylmuramyl pentapeptide synthase